MEVLKSIYLVCSIKLQIKYIRLEVVFFQSACCFDFHEISRNVRIFLHSIGESLTESFNLVSNVWHVEIMM